MHTRLMGLKVTDQASYQRYRDGMTPILGAYGGRFICDFRVAETLLPAGSGINRVFVVQFPDVAAQDAFFADPAYVEVRAAHFDPAVEFITMLAEFEPVATYLDP